MIEEIDDEFREAQKFSQGSSLIRRRLAEEINSDVEPEIAGDDPDANWLGHRPKREPLLSPL